MLWHTESPATVDSYEDGDIGEYSGDTSVFSVVDESNLSFAAIDGSKVLEAASGSTGEIYSTSGLANYFPKGAISDLYLRLGSSFDSAFRIWFALADTDNFYMVNIVAGDEHKLFVNDAGTFSSLASDATDPVLGEWVRVRLVRDDGTLGGSDNDLVVQVFTDDTGNGAYDNRIVNITANDSTHTTADGIGVRQHASPADNAWVDDWTVIE